MAGNERVSDGGERRAPLSNAERQRRFKQRRREEAAAAERTAAESAGGVPERPAWQRPPFESGNLLSLRAGHRSERTLIPRAEAILAEARADPGWPAYLDKPVFAASVAAWARAEAMSQLYTEYIAGETPEVWSTEFAVGEEKITGGGDQGGPVTRKSQSRKTGPSLDMWRALEAHASAQRTKLGLDPLARARLGRDVAAGLDLAQVMAELSRREKTAS